MVVIMVGKIVFCEKIVVIIENHVRKPFVKPLNFRNGCAENIWWLNLGCALRRAVMPQPHPQGGRHRQQLQRDDAPLPAPLLMYGRSGHLCGVLRHRAAAAACVCLTVDAAAALLDVGERSPD